MTEDTKNIRDIKAIKAIKVPGPLDKATGKMKKLNQTVQAGPRRLVPKKMAINNTKVEVSVEQLEEDEIEWIWECAADKPGEEDVIQETYDSASARHIVEERRFLKDVVALLQPTRLKHKKKKEKATKHAPRKVEASPSTGVNETSDTTSTNTKNRMHGKDNSDHEDYAYVIDDNKEEEEDNDGHKAHERDNGEREDKDKKQKPDSSLVVKQGQQREMEEERKKRLGRRLQKDLAKGLRMQKNLHMKLHSQLKSQKDLELMAAILTELEKGLKLQKMVETVLRLRKKMEDGLDESKQLDAKVCAEDTEATRALPLSVDLQASAA